jgi:hypothetical protein
MPARHVGTAPHGSNRFAWARKFAIASGACAFLTLLSGEGRAASRSEVLEDRREQVSHMQPSEQQELLRRQERFLALPLEEQNRLRKLQAQLDADPNSERLNQTLLRYHEWLKTLTPAQRARLAELPAEERVSQIKRMRQQQHAARERSHQADLLTWQDMKQVLRWTEDFVWERREALLEEMSSEQRQRFEKWDRQRQKRILLTKAVERARRQGGRGGLSTLEETDVKKLAEKLSEPARKELAAADTLAAKRRMVGTWIGIAMHRLESWPISRRQNPLVADDLLQYLQNDVPPAERERLLKLPREKMLEELRGMYFERPREPGARNADGPRFEGRGPEHGKGYRGRGPRGKAPEKAGAPADRVDSSRPDPAEVKKPAEKAPAEAAPASEEPQSN